MIKRLCVYFLSLALVLPNFSIFAYASEISENSVLKEPKKTGYTFEGWYSDSKFTKKVTTVPKGSTGTTTLYAKWKVNKYNIAFKGNGSTSGSMKKMSNCKYGKKYTLRANAFKRKGYTFTGWNTKADGSGIAYDDKTSVKNLTSKNGKTVTLYAQWKIKKYDITYKLNGGKNNSVNPKRYTIKNATTTLKEPSKEGYKFVGWYSDKKCTKQVKSIKKGTTGNKKLYAKWKAEKYTIKYNLNEGKNNSENPTSYKITTSTIKLQNPTREGYTFEGWYSDSSYTNQVKRIKKGSTGNKTLYAKWEKISNEDSDDNSNSDSNGSSAPPELPDHDLPVTPPQTEEDKTEENTKEEDTKEEDKNNDSTNPEEGDSVTGGTNSGNASNLGELIVLPDDVWN